jgi:hypothetical protein
MKNFLKIASLIDVKQIVDEIQEHSELWDTNRLRTTHHMSPHTQVSDIWVRFNKLPDFGKEHLVLDEHESIWYPAGTDLPSVRAFVFALMARVQGERLGRVIITKLVPGAKIDAHVDSGSHAEYYERFHLCLKNNPGSYFRCGDESVCMAPGDVWWFDNSIEHEVVNDSDQERWTIIVDIKIDK